MSKSGSSEKSNSSLYAGLAVATLSALSYFYYDRVYCKKPKTALTKEQFLSVLSKIEASIHDNADRTFETRAELRPKLDAKISSIELDMYLQQQFAKTQAADEAKITSDAKLQESDLEDAAETFATDEEVTTKLAAIKTAMQNAVLAAPECPEDCTLERFLEFQRDYWIARGDATVTAFNESKTAGAEPLDSISPEFQKILRAREAELLNTAVDALKARYGWSWKQISAAVEQYYRSPLYVTKMEAIKTIYSDKLKAAGLQTKKLPSRK